MKMDSIYGILVTSVIGVIGTYFTYKQYKKDSSPINITPHVEVKPEIKIDSVKILNNSYKDQDKKPTEILELNDDYYEELGTNIEKSKKYSSKFEIKEY